MEILNFLFNLLGTIYTKLNFDFFGLGFGFFDIILGSILICALLRFLFQGISSTSGSISMSGFELGLKTKISNDKRKSALLKSQQQSKSKKKKEG